MTRAAKILAKLDQLYPDAECELRWRNPFELLVATILSAQCTDERVNETTPALFARYPTPQALAAADPEAVEALVRSTGFFRNKTKNIIGASRRLVEAHGGEVPGTMEELIALPGVARKTANVVAGTSLHKALGVVVDTHVTRLAARLGLTKAKDPVDIERDLMKAWPREKWIKAAHQLVWHGRRVCHARKPKCTECGLAPLCPSAFEV